MIEGIIVTILIILSPLIFVLGISIIYSMLMIGIWVFGYIDYLIWDKLFGGRE